MRDKIIGFIISVVCFIISFGFVKGQAMALPFVPTDWTWEMYQGLHMLGDLIANDVNFDIPDWVDFNDFDDVKAFLEMIYNEGKHKVAYASIIADMCVGTWQNFLETGEVSLPFSESTVKRAHNTGFFQHIADTIEEITVEPNPDYVSFLNTINGSGFFWRDYSNTFNDSGYTQSVYILPCSSYSWFSVPVSANLNYNSYILDYDGSAACYASSIIDLYIVSSGSSYSISTNLSPIAITGINDWNGQTYNACYFPSGRDFVELRGYNNNFNYTFNASGSLSDILSLIAQNFRNVNIYVNGAPWALGGIAIDNPLGVVIPQNVIDEVESGKISGLVIDATLPDTDNLVGSIDLGVVMDELREAQANGRNATLDGVRTKDGVRAIDGTVVGTVSKAVAIDVPSTASLVSAADDWGYIPYYPEIPSAFSGTTILSELIDATQTIIPNDLIMAIWGLVIILFIIALINIFHK